MEQLTAQEAASIADAVNTPDKTIERLLKTIKDLASIGKRYTFSDKPLTEDEQVILKGLGYTIEQTSFSEHKIIW